MVLLGVILESGVMEILLWMTGFSDVFKEKLYVHCILQVVVHIFADNFDIKELYS